jgi:hypothetical protein
LEFVALTREPFHFQSIAAEASTMGAVWPACLLGLDSPSAVKVTPEMAANAEAVARFSL